MDIWNHRVLLVSSVLFLCALSNRKRGAKLAERKNTPCILLRNMAPFLQMGSYFDHWIELHRKSFQLFFTSYVSIFFCHCCKNPIRFFFRFVSPFSELWHLDHFRVSPIFSCFFHSAHRTETLKKISIRRNLWEKNQRYKINEAWWRFFLVPQLYHVVIKHVTGASKLSYITVRLFLDMNKYKMYFFPVENHVGNLGQVVWVTVLRPHCTKAASPLRWSGGKIEARAQKKTGESKGGGGAEASHKDRASFWDQGPNADLGVGDTSRGSHGGGGSGKNWSSHKNLGCGWWLKRRTQNGGPKWGDEKQRTRGAISPSEGIFGGSWWRHPPQRIKPSK